jgi:hypothetical protein
MATIQRIGPTSAFKVGFVVYGCLGFLAGILCSAIAFAGVPFATHEHLPRIVTLFAVVLCPIVSGLIGAVGTLISALLCNLASGLVGGLEADVR